MQERFLAYIEEKKLFSSEDSLLCAVSGGVDSMVLLELLRRSEYSVAVGHMNHKKRGEESDADARFVQDYCEKYGLVYYEKELAAMESSGNFQQYAREERYKWFDQLAADNQYTYILTAHHFDDKVETLLINMFRGTGFKALGSIFINKTNIVRPLIDFSKEDIMAFASSEGISFREDQSNETDDYFRNRIRHHLIREIKKLDSRDLKGLRLSIDNLENETSLLEELRDNALRDCMVIESDQCVFDLLKIKKYRSSETLLFSFLREWKFSMTQVKNVLHSNSNGATFETKNCMAILKGNYLTIYEKSISDPVMKLVETDGQYEFLANSISISICEDEDRNLESGQYLGFEEYPFPLILRMWKEGDKFAPFGLSGKWQKLKKYFVNEKLNIVEKQRVPILEYRGEICHVVGMRTSHNFRVLPTSKFVLKVGML